MSQEKIEEISKKINNAREHYYNRQSIMSDTKFDSLIEELEKLDPKNLAIIGIGAEPVSNWEKYAHKVPMGSLNKVQTDREYLDWHNKYIKNEEALLTLKLDGLSVSLVYEKGILIKAATRGGGTVGELITPNVARMIGIPLRLSESLNMTARGEILLSKTNHQQFFADYSNSRNGASGISRRYDGEGSDKLTVLCYQLLSDEFSFDTHQRQFEKLTSLGFQVPFFYLCKNAFEVIEHRNNYTNTLREQYDFDLDGLVIHLNDLAKHTEFGSRDKRPYASIAFKFDSIAKEGTVSDIVLQVGNGGRIVPVAVFEPPISLMGAEVRKASLHNFSMVKELGIGVGAKVLVSRRNDVIPYVEEVLEKPEIIFTAPSNCPMCDSIVIENGEYVECQNDACPARVVGKIKNWVKELDLLELGDTLMEKLVENGLVKDVSDLYLLKVKDLEKLPRMGRKSAENVHKSIWSKKEITLDIMLGGLSIPLIGSTSIRLLMDAGYDTLEKVMAMTQAEMQAIKGMGSARSESLVNGLLNNKSIITALLANGVSLKQKEEKKMDGKLSGKTFVMTGTLSMKRDEVSALIEEAGGTVQGSVSKTTQFLIIADPDSQSSKAVKARKMNVKCIDETTLMSMLNA